MPQPKNNSGIKFLSYLGVSAVMAFSSLYFYTTWKSGDPKWYFLILALAIAILLLSNVWPKNRDRRR